LGTLAYADTDNSVILSSYRNTGFALDLNDHVLTVTNGLRIEAPLTTEDRNYERVTTVNRYIDASGSTLNVGGDLVVNSQLTYAGYTGWTQGADGQWGVAGVDDDNNSSWAVGPDGQPGVALVDDDGDTVVDNITELGFAGSDDVFTNRTDDLSEAGWAGSDDVLTLYEHRNMGITGDALTVINLQGSFTSNVRAMDATFNGLTLSTVNLLGGDPYGFPETFEVTGDPLAMSFAAGSGAIGVLNIGADGDVASVALVNDYVNDNDPTNTAKVKDGEVLLVGSLSIINGKLDCNGNGVLVNSSTLSISENGTLDLHTFATLSEGSVYPAFAGIGDQTATWSTFKARVVDSTPGNEALTFEPYYDSLQNLTFWKVPGSGPLPPDADQSEVTATTPVVADGVATSTITITVKDAEGTTMEGLAGDISVVVGGSNNSVSAVTEVGAGVYTATVASTTAEVKTVTVTVSTVELSDKPTVVFTAPPLPDLVITASLDYGWVYPNTPVTTQNRHKSVLTVDITSGSVVGETYAITLGENGGAVTNFQVTQPVAIVAGTPATVDILGGLRTTAVSGTYTINVTVTGTPGGQVATQNVTLKLRLLGDIVEDDIVNASDKLEMNKKLNGLENLAGITLRDLDLSGDGALVNAEDKLAINQILNGLIVP
jgi:hypothetical protein